MEFILLLTGTFASRIQYAALYGNVQQFGYYYVDIQVGSPPMKQTVIVDTGSRLTAFPCINCINCGQHIDSYFNYTASISSRMVTCDQGVECSSCTNNICHYKQSYAQGSRIQGVLVQDLVRFGDHLNQEQSVRFKFGCHSKETRLFKTQLADGIMGLAYPGQNMKTLYDALYEDDDIDTDLFSICLASEGGVMAIGGYNTSFHYTPLQWVPLYGSSFFGIRAHDLMINGHSIGLTQQDFTTQYTSGTIIDSGTTFVYLATNVYTKLYSQFFQYCNNQAHCKGEKSRGVLGQDCFAYKKDNFENIDEFFDSFPIISIVVEEIAVNWRPKYYLVEFPESPGKYCLGVLANGRHGNVLGSVFMRGLDVVFDKLAQEVAFAESDCDGVIQEYTHHNFIQLNEVPIVKNEESYGWSAVFFASFWTVVLVFICMVVYAVYKKNRRIYSVIGEIEDVEV